MDRKFYSKHFLIDLLEISNDHKSFLFHILLIVTLFIISIILLFIAFMKKNKDLKAIKSYEKELLKRNLQLSMEIELSNRLNNQINHIGKNFKGGMLFQLTLKNNEFYFSYISESCKDLYGFSQEEILGNPNIIFDKIHPDDFIKIKEEERNAIENKSNFDMEIRIRNTDGSYRWAYSIESPTIISSSYIIFDGIELDITERKIAQLELINYKDNLEEIIKQRVNELDIARKEAERSNKYKSEF